MTPRLVIATRPATNRAPARPRTRRARAWGVGAACAGLIALAACGTKDGREPLEPTGAVGRVRFVNVITDTTRGRVNASIGGTLLGVNLTYGMTVPGSLPAPSTAPYASILTGSRTIALTRTADTTVQVAALEFSVADSQDVTVYAVGGAAATPVAPFVTSDSNPAPAAGQVRLRVVHLSPTAGAVDIFATAVGADLAAATPIAAGVALRTASAYVAVPAGTSQLRAVRAGVAPAARAGNVVINLASVVLAGGAARTVVAADNNVGGAPLRFIVLSDR